MASSSNNTLGAHRYRKGDIARGEAATDLLVDFLTHPNVKALLGNCTIEKVTDKDENIHRGDVRLTWADGHVVYFEAKSVSHDITARDGADRGFYTQQRTGYPTTIIEVAKRRSKSSAVTVDPQQKVWDCLTMGGDLDDVMEGWSLDALHDIRINHNPKKTEHGAPRRFGDVPFAHTNLLPYKNGAIGAYVDLQERSINFHEPVAVARAIWHSISEHGIYDSPGNVDPGGLVARHIPYGPLGTALNKDGQWYPVVPRGTVTGSPAFIKGWLENLGGRHGCTF